MPRINSWQIQNRYTNRTLKPRHVPRVSTSRRRADWDLKGIFFKDESRSTNARGQTKLQIICNCGIAREGRDEGVQEDGDRVKERTRTYEGEKKMKQRKNASETVVFRRKRNYKEANPRNADSMVVENVPRFHSRGLVPLVPFSSLSLFLRRFLRLL